MQFTFEWDICITFMWNDASIFITFSGIVANDGASKRLRVRFRSGCLANKRCLTCHAATDHWWWFQTITFVATCWCFDNVYWASGTCGFLLRTPLIIKTAKWWIGRFMMVIEINWMNAAHLRGGKRGGPRTPEWSKCYIIAGKYCGVNNRKFASKEI